MAVVAAGPAAGSAPAAPGPAAPAVAELLALQAELLVLEAFLVEHAGGDEFLVGPSRALLQDLRADLATRHDVAAIADWRARLDRVLAFRLAGWTEPDEDVALAGAGGAESGAWIDATPRPVGGFDGRRQAPALLTRAGGAVAFGADMSERGSWMPTPDGD